MTQDKRRHTRIPYQLRAEVTHASELLIAETVELSLGGVRIVTDDMLTVGSTVSVTLNVPRESAGAKSAGTAATTGEDDDDDDEVEVEVEEDAFESSMTVRWSRARPDGMCIIGLSFGPLTAAEKKELARIVERVS